MFRVAGCGVARGCSCSGLGTGTRNAKLDARNSKLCMDNLLSRHRNLTVLVVVLCAQVVGLAVQVKHPAEGGSVRLVRLWAVSTITPLEKGVVNTREWVGNLWRNYFYLRNVRKENEALRAEIERMRLEQVRLGEDAGQARRLQALLGFKEQFIQQTLPAQVISTTGSEFSRGVYIDKGSRDGLKADMPVITPEGIVGKTFRVYPSSSLVLVINDPTSGVGVILEKSRLQGILKGAPNGETQVYNIMADEQVQVGERVLTSGGDRIYPKGLPAGVVSSVAPGADPIFVTVRVKPAAQLSRLEEVLVLTKVVEKTPEGTESAGQQRAADILAERLPSVPAKPPEAAPGTAPAGTQKLPPNAPATSGGAEPGKAKPQAPEGRPPAPANALNGTPPKPAGAAAGATTNGSAAPKKSAESPGTTATSGVSGAQPKSQVTAPKKSDTGATTTGSTNGLPPPKKPVVSPGTATAPGTSNAQPKPPVAPAAAPKKPVSAQPGTPGPGTPAAPKPAGATPAANPPKPKPADGAGGKSTTNGAKPEAPKPDATKPQIPPSEDTPWQ